MTRMICTKLPMSLWNSATRQQRVLGEVPLERQVVRVFARYGSSSGLPAVTVLFAPVMLTAAPGARMPSPVA